MTLAVRHEDELTSGGECYLHNHPEDRVQTHDTLNRLQSLASVQTKVASYTLTYSDDWIAVSATSTMTLPVPRSGKEFVIVNIAAAATVTIASPAGTTINGTASIAIVAQWQAMTIKPLSVTEYLAI